MMSNLHWTLINDFDQFTAVFGAMMLDFFVEKYNCIAAYAQAEP